MELKQFVPTEYCQKCDVCCRFLDDETPLAPTNIPLIPHKDRFICTNFDPAHNNCKDYENRPLDCRLYPFVVMWDEGYKNVVLGVDPKCPYIEKFQINSKFEIYKNYLLITLEGINPRYIARFQDDIKILDRLTITEKEPVLRKLLIGDKKLFEKYAAQTDRPLSSHSFAANYVWTGLLGYYWTIIDGNFCLFCKTMDTIFMPIPPLGKKISAKAVKESFKLMDVANKNKNCSRIEDVSEKGLRFFKDLGYKIKEKGQEYICRQRDLAELAGDKYKAKRALCNYFEKNYRFEYREFSAEGGSASGGRKGDMNACPDLFRKWGDDRKRVYKDDYYAALLEDSYPAHKKAMERYEELGLVGRVVLVNNKILAYTFGHRLSEDTLVVLFEVADLKTKGLSQFIFREFCSEQDSYKYINLMDDSGLENLKKTKMSYHPVKIEKAFCAYE